MGWGITKGEARSPFLLFNNKIFFINLIVFYRTGHTKKMKRGDPVKLLMHGTHHTNTLFLVDLL